MEYKNLVPMGYIQKKPIYYDLSLEQLYFSKGNETSKNQTSVLLAKILFSLPVIYFFDRYFIIETVVTRIIILILFIMIASLYIKKFNKNQYNTIKLESLQLSSSSFTEFVNEQDRNVKILGILFIFANIFLLFFLLLFIWIGTIMNLVILGGLIVIDMLTISNRLYLKREILKRIKKNMINS